MALSLPLHLPLAPSAACPLKCCVDSAASSSHSCGCLVPGFCSNGSAAVMGLFEAPLSRRKHERGGSSLKVPLLRRLERPCAGGARGNGAFASVSRRNRTFRGPSARFGGGGKSSDGKKDDKKFITKEQEPEEFWQTTAEKEGKNPMQTLLPYIALLSLLSPFAILAVAFANNWIKLPGQ